MAAFTSPMLAPAEANGRWLEVVSHTDPKYGGLSAAVPTLGKAVAQGSGFKISLAAFAASEEHFKPAGYTSEDLSFWPMSRRRWLHDESLHTSFAEQVRRCDGVHIHGLWEQSTAIAARTAREVKMPYILSAHGMLEPWALATKRLKKLVYGHFVERRNVAGAACLHALTHAEAGHFVRFGARSPVAVIPNGVAIPRAQSASLFLDRFPALNGKPIILFLARLHAKKGLDLLLQAWTEIARRFPDARLVLAGPGSPAEETKLRRFVGEHRLEQSVLVTGMLRDQLKWSAFAAAECFVLPSYSEGLSMSVLEAMGMGLPVILTRSCNMPEVEEHRAGWQIEPEVPELTAALSDVLNRSSTANAATGRRGAALIEARYTWEIVGLQMAEVYRWVQGGAIPTTVEMVYP